MPWPCATRRKSTDELAVIGTSGRAESSAGRARPAGHTRPSDALAPGRAELIADIEAHPICWDRATQDVVLIATSKTESERRNPIYFGSCAGSEMRLLANAGEGTQGPVGRCAVRRRTALWRHPQVSLRKGGPIGALGCHLRQNLDGLNTNLIPPGCKVQQ